MTQPAPPLDPRLTEQRNPATAEIDLASPLEIVEMMNAQDRLVPEAVRAVRHEIARAIELVEAAFRAGGRLLYVGAAPAAGSACWTPPSARRPSAPIRRWSRASSPAAFRRSSEPRRRGG